MAFIKNNKTLEKQETLNNYKNLASKLHGVWAQKLNIQIKKLEEEISEDIKINNINIIINNKEEEEEEKNNIKDNCEEEEEKNNIKDICEEEEKNNIKDICEEEEEEKNNIKDICEEEEDSDWIKITYK